MRNAIKVEPSRAARLRGGDAAMAEGVMTAGAALAEMAYLLGLCGARSRPAMD